MTLCSLLSLFCISGVATVVDGDTLRVHDKFRGTIAIRLWGIDAPELHEPYGTASKHQLELLLANRQVICSEYQHGRSHHRVVAKCKIDGLDLGTLMVRAGAALDCPTYSQGHYAPFEPRDIRRQLTPKPYC